MTKRLRPGLVRVAVVTALVGATPVVSAAPATAAAPAIRILSVSSENVEPGESVRVRFRATNKERGTATVFVAVSGGLRCTGGCSASKEIGAGRSETFEATVVAPQVSPGEVSGRNLAVSVRVGRQTAFDHKMILVHGSGKPSAAVSRVSGRIRDTGGKAIAGATLAVRDSAGHDYRATTDRGGRFSIRSSAGRPIAVGPITVVAAKDGYRTARATVRGAAGAAATVRLTLTAAATPATTSPSPAAGTSAPVPADEPATEEGSAEVVPLTAGRPAGGEGSSSLLFTLLGGLLVVAGLGALVLMLIRRRNPPDEPDPPVGAYGSGRADAPTAVLRTVPRNGG